MRYPWWNLYDEARDFIKALLGQQEGSASKGISHQAQWPKFHPWDSHGRSRELTPMGCSLTSTHFITYCPHNKSYSFQQRTQWLPASLVVASPQSLSHLTPDMTAWWNTVPGIPLPTQQSATTIQGKQGRGQLLLPYSTPHLEVWVSSSESTDNRVVTWDLISEYTKNT